MVLLAAQPLAAAQNNQAQNRNTRNLALCTDLTNAKVMDQPNQEVGQSQDVVLQEPIGQIRYIVLEVNNKKVALPWTALTAQNNRNQNQNQNLQFSIRQTRDQLQNARTFSPNDLSNLVTNDIRPDADRQEAGRQANAQNNRNPDLVLASKVRGAKVQTSDNEQVGQIRHLVVATDRGQVQFGVVEANGQQVAVPWYAFRELNPSSSEENIKLVVDRTKDQLQNAPKFERNDLSNLPAGSDAYGMTGSSR